ncbi:MAG: hypothetical protein M1834_002224 [Cirrosporium novae-zelandiae]|nr:MAG: hypothetical protein M1834_002224 [Cirrosporium novae-zelandiae]
MYDIHVRCHQMPPEETGGRSYVRRRVAAACSSCKARKVKCDGQLPCAYCKRRMRPDSCKYLPHHRRGFPYTSPTSSIESLHPSNSTGPDILIAAPIDPPGANGDSKAEEETIVPREGRLLCDGQGKLSVFIGDSAPLSFLQTVRQLITTRIGQTVLTNNTPRDYMIEHIPAKQASIPKPNDLIVTPERAEPMILSYLSATSGMLDVFNSTDLIDSILAWSSVENQKTENLTSAVNYLVLAIGCQAKDEYQAEIFFNHARDIALRGLGENLSISTVQAFALVTMYMLAACEGNGAFIYFGRPPATSDIDCTVLYKTMNKAEEKTSILDASVQIFLIIERVIVEIYSRKQISLQLAESISHHLRDWATNWLQRLRNSVKVCPSSPERPNQGEVIGACQALCSYYYAIMLLTRPFLLYELNRRLSTSAMSTGIQGSSGQPNGDTEKAKFADACIDSATLLVDLVQDLIERRMLPWRMPLVVSWLFTTSLVLGLALLGDFGRIFEKYAGASIHSLEYFAKRDPHALQYSSIAKSLVATALEHLEKKELQERHQRIESTSQLFGLIHGQGEEQPVRLAPKQLEPDFANGGNEQNGVSNTRRGIIEAGVPNNSQGSLQSIPDVIPPDWTGLDMSNPADYLTLSGGLSHHTEFSDDVNLGDGQHDLFGELSLFPVFEASETFDFGHTIT